MSNLMEMVVYNAAVNGDLTIFSNQNHEQLLKKTHQNNNIIHIAANYKQINFIKAALNNFPSIPNCESLICDQNSHGNTPVHIAAEVGDESIINHLYEFFSTHCGGSDRVFPWRVINKDRNTPAHVALLYGNVRVAMYLVEKDDSVARELNLSKKSLLHLAIQYHDFDNYEPQMADTQAPSSNKEDLWPIIELLLKTESSVACWTDADGSTPVHRAATLEPAYCIRVIKAMLASCPGAAEVHDERYGQTILHLLANHQVANYEQGLELLQIPQIYAVRNSKNHQGDTPLHLAARNRDTTMVRVLLGSSPKLGLMNDSGVSAGSLVRQLEEMKFTETPVEEMRKLTKEEREAAEKGDVAFLNEKMVSVGMNLLVSQPPNGGNILHILMQCNVEYDYGYATRREFTNEVVEFIERSIQRMPLLICQKDCNGNTPVHILVEHAHSIRLLESSYKYFKKAQEEARGVARGALSCPPWRLKNVQGEMPLHVAVRALQHEAAVKLLELDNEAAFFVNNRKQNPLHLLCLRNGLDYGNVVEDLIRHLINGNGDLAYMQDEDGLTPLLTAIRERNIFMIKKLHQQFPNCCKIADFKGRTFWHWFVSPRPEQNNILSDDDNFGWMGDAYRFVVSLDNTGRITGRFASQMASRDEDGNTPLHLAIENRRFGFARFFLDNCHGADWGVGWWGSVELTYKILLSAENKKGVSCYNLIGSADHLPNEFEEDLFKKGNLLRGHRSMYGVPTTKIEAYANTIGVIAALLATITFTAAFTVPGGLDSSNGTPLLLRKAIFQAFMVADMVAMCSSIMVLFCLLWIMTTGKEKESILLLDVSVFLLQTSLHATLVTFMTGLYVTTISIVPAIAISTCVTCTFLIILMHKRLVMFAVVPFFGKFIILGHMVGRFAGNHLYPVWSSFKNHIISSLGRLDSYLYELFHR